LTCKARRGIHRPKWLHFLAEDSILTPFNLLLTASIAALLLSISCESESPGSTLQTTSNVPQYRLAVTDSFGVEVGDSLNMIGAIAGFCYHTDGSLLILDPVYGKVRIVPDSGSPGCFGRQGYGPGEFGYPQGLCVMDDGRILVSEGARREILEFDERGTYLGEFMDTRIDNVPSEMFTVDSNSIAGLKYEYEISQGQLTNLVLVIGRFDGDCEPAVRYFEYACDLSSDEFYTYWDLSDFCADPAGKVYIAPDVTEYRIRTLSSDGSCMYQIELDIERIEKSDDQVQIEIEQFEDGHEGDSSYHGNFQPYSYTQLISLVGVDTLGCLWVERFDVNGSYNLDVWDSTGCLAYQVTLPEFVYDLDLTFHVDRGGVLGANPDSDLYPRIYVFDIQDKQSSNDDCHI
jgi:hypothetical protein